MEVGLASPPPAAAPSTGRLHPTYKEMILQALTELRDPSGSSRGAIDDYLTGHFSGLHSRHDDLLDIHLRSLVSHGQLRLVSGNYFVSTATQRPGLAPGQKRGRGRPRKNPDLAASASVPAFQGPKRGRGRPRKNPVASSPSPLQGAPTSGVKRGRGRPRKNASVPSPSSSSAPLGGAIAPSPPSGVKRGRGRPRKNAFPVRSSFSQLLGVAIAQPPPSGVKRGRGRPRKTAYSAVAPLVRAEQGPAGGLPQRNTTPLSSLPATMPHSGKSTPVRLPRIAVDVSALRGSSVNVSACSNRVDGEEKMQPESVQSADASLTKRGRGRPRKEKALESGYLKAAQMTEGRLEALTAQAADQAGAVQNEVETRDLQSLGTSLIEKKMTDGHQGALTAQAADQAGAVQNEVEARDLQSLGSSLTQKRGRGRPRKRPLETETAEAGVAVSTVKRGRGRPRKEKTLETGNLKVAQMTEGPHEALPAQAADQAGAVQNEVEPRDLQSLGSSLTEKRGRGRPRKRPLTAEAGVAASTVKRGRGRPRKEKTLETGDLEVARMTESQLEALPAQAVDQTGPMQNEAEARILLSFGTPVMKRGRGRPRKRPLETETAETKDSALVKKRGRGRPRKARPFETGSVGTAVEVSSDLTKVGPEKDGHLVSGKEAETQGVLLVEGIDDGPADAGCLVVSREELAIAPMDAGGVVLSGEEAAIAPVDAGRAMPRAETMDLGTKSN